MDRAIDLEIAREAAERWDQRTAPREAVRAKLAGGEQVTADTPERVRLRLEHLTSAATEQRVSSAEAPRRGQPRSLLRSEQAASGTSPLVATIGLERVMGKPDFLGIQFLEMALAVARFVGRVHIRSAPGRSAGFGTGFIVSPRLLLTNNHVLPTHESAVHSEVEFDYQYDRAGRLLPVVTYGLEPQTFFLTDRALDYTLVAVREVSVDQRAPLTHYGWSRLIEAQGKALLGDPLNIIQHPRGEAKQIVLRSNQLIDLFDQFAHYVADTDPGSSGSPVYNDQWEVVALHHAGVPKRDATGNYVAKNGTVWRSGMDPDDLAWVANEGIRVSALVDHIRRQPLPVAQRRLRAELLDLEPPHPIEAALLATDAAGRGSERPGVATPSQDRDRPMSDASSPAAGSQTWTVPLLVTVQVGTPVLSVSAAASDQAGQASAVPPVGPGTRGAHSPPSTAGPTDKLAAAMLPDPSVREALAELDAAERREYYDEVRDQQASDRYYEGMPQNASPADLYDWLHALLERTHTRPLRYAPVKHVYPWVDLHEAGPGLKLVSIYSGRDADPREFIEADVRVDQERLRLHALFRAQAAPSAGSGSAPMEVLFEALEAQLPYNCEHVVPQSWFGKREPMRGDLHHLFACESGCNSFRGNIPFYDFPDFEEVIREACGKREELKFEPAAGKGAVARATLYFLLRYTGEINATAKEYRPDRVQTLLEWHEADPPNRYEWHRNAAIQEKQGNRNPLIDIPDLGRRIDFLRGLG